MSNPNFLIIMTDQQRKDALSCVGRLPVKTPHLDKLAASGVRFENAYTPAPVCMPARSSFLSGLFAHNHGQWRNHHYLSPHFDTFGKRLQTLNYRTCYVGKAHLYGYKGITHLNEMKQRMHDLGFDDVFETTGPGGISGVQSIYSDYLKEKGLYETLINDHKKRSENGGHNSTWPTALPAGETLEDFIGKTTTDYITSYDRDQPFCAFVNFGGPHAPMDPPKEFADWYDPTDTGTWKEKAKPGEWVSEKSANHQNNFPKAGAPGQDEDIHKFRAAYFAKISHIDDWVGKLIQTLKDTGRYENTVILFCSDHGEHLGDHGRGGKFTFYEESAGVPMLVRMPNETRESTTCSKPISLTDVFATLVDIADGDTERCGVGKSFLPLLKDSNAEFDHTVFGEHVNRTLVRTDDWKMVIDFEGDVLLLFNMKEDPEELNNLAGKPGTESIVNKMKERLLAWHLRAQVFSHGVK